VAFVGHHAAQAALRLGKWRGMVAACNMAWSVHMLVVVPCCGVPLPQVAHTICIVRLDVQVHVTQKDKEECVQRYDDAFTFFHGTWDAALEAGYTCAHPKSQMAGHGTHR
jgi:hypothetical protein